MIHKPHLFHVFISYFGTKDYYQTVIVKEFEKNTYHTLSNRSCIAPDKK